MRATRIVLLALGAAGIVYGAWLLVTTQRPDQLLSVALWLAGAIIAHDFVLVPLLTLARGSRGSRGSATS
ncbi:hypothetical protein DY023_16470 [Microbacterium bovistercoris]|uniref:Uncharacterized protein n=1 Tax=Microbacterium bovistercoris TaxID=2293570 RepID=A0A371NP10_9MICO|nr:hypothetical protein [Microbacterium bovistercoris]REJ03914.1 hypothetical protein DY023_16470 [Microbacterium bovistercoris]